MVKYTLEQDSSSYVLETSKEDLPSTNVLETSNDLGLISKIK